MDIFILIVFLIYLILFDNKKIIKRLFFIYLILIILYNIYKCVFIKKIEGFESSDNNDYNKKIYDILKDNILSLQDVNSLKQYETNFKNFVDKLNDSINGLKTEFEITKNTTTISNKTFKDCLANTPQINDNSTNIATTEFVNNIVNPLKLEFKFDVQDIYYGVKPNEWTSYPIVFKTKFNSPPYVFLTLSQKADLDINISNILVKYTTISGCNVVIGSYGRNMNTYGYINILAIGY